MSMIAGSLGVIPARLASRRLPRKPLHVIAGRPLIEWVWRRVSSLGLTEALVVATESDEVAQIVRAFGGEAVITDPDHPSGTDRVAEVANLPAYRSLPYILNVQGDEPFVTATQIRAVLSLVAEEGWAVGTAATPLRNVSEWTEPSTVKVVTGDRGHALYFSRASIPYARDMAASSIPNLALRHLGLYAYTREALMKWVSLPVAPLEGVEKLEQLRPLSAGLSIGVALVDMTDGGIDTLDDARRAETLLRAS